MLSSFHLNGNALGFQVRTTFYDTIINSKPQKYCSLPFLFILELSNLSEFEQGTSSFVITTLKNEPPSSYDVYLLMIYITRMAVFIKLLTSINPNEQREKLN